ncbi:hypothetical protein V6N13_136892 [Hibiscus sabdariffa]|uniref:Uncharacterized protein n=1 Tax=Hibiscus sabdariffa TaxID=183260 RepID=A0ABR2DM87_9ROSI
MAVPSPCMIKEEKEKEKEKALKPKTKSLKRRVHGIKAEMGRIREDQRRIREEQRSIGERFGDVKRQCDELRLETETILKQSALNRIRLGIMFSILRARQDGDFDQAAAFTAFLSSISDTRKF